MKKHVTAMILLSVISMLTASCSDGQDPVSQDTLDTTPVTEAVTEAPIFTDHLPERDWSGADYTVLAAAEQWANKFWVEAENGAIIDDAVFKRNAAVEDRFNIRFVYDFVNGYTAGQATVRQRLNNAVMAGDATYDHFVGDSYYIAGQVLEGIFTNLVGLEYLDFSQPYWFPYVNPNLRVGDTQFIASGAYDLQTVGENWVILFNKELAEQYDMTSFYDDVRAGIWTMDRFMSYAKQVPQDLNGDGAWDENDRYGLLGTQNEAFIGLNYGMGRTITALGENGLPYLTGTDEKIVNIMDTLTHLLKDDHMYFGSEVNNPSELIVPMFSNNQGMFLSYLLRVLETEAVRINFEFGILPQPKYDEAQETYHSCTIASISAIPFVCPDLERSQIILEALNSASYALTLPAYKEQALQRKLSRDEESADMLDLIFAGSVCDFGLAYVAQINGSLYTVGGVLSGNQDWATWWAKQEKSTTKKLNNLIAKMQELGDR